MGNEGKPVIIDINTKKKTKLRERPSVKAKRWDLLMKWIESGLITITIAGTTLSKKEMDAFAEELDAGVEEEAKQQTKLKVQRHRRKKKFDT